MHASEPYAFRLLLATDARASFHCGVRVLDDYLRTQALQQQERHLSTTLVIADGDNVLAYVTYANKMFVGNEGKPARRFGPHVLLARLAVAEGAKGKGRGEALVGEIIRHALHMRDNGGCLGVLVHAKRDPDVVPFYERFGFVEQPSWESSAGTTAMFLPLPRRGRP